MKQSNTLRDGSKSPAAMFLIYMFSICLFFVSVFVLSLSYVPRNAWIYVMEIKYNSKLG